MGANAPTAPTLTTALNCDTQLSLFLRMETNYVKSIFFEKQNGGWSQKSSFEINSGQIQKTTGPKLKGQPGRLLSREKVECDKGGDEAFASPLLEGESAH